MSAVVIILLVIICTVSIRFFLHINIQDQQALDRIEEAKNALFKSLIDQETGQRGYNLTEDVTFLEPYDHGRKQFAESSKELMKRTKNFPALSREMKDIIQKGQYWQDQYAKPLVDMTFRGGQPSVQILQEGKQTLDDFRHTADDFSHHIEVQRSHVRNTMQKGINITLSALMTILIGIVIMNLLINFRLLKSVIKPIIELSNCVKFYTKHDFTKGIPTYRKKDELFELIENVDFMRTELSNSISSLESKVNYDALTGLYNRRYFNECIIKEWEAAKENSVNFSLILFDIDHYKNFNDTYGHLAGDECLKIISQRLQSCIVNPLDFIARYGGEEFAVLLLERTEQEALAIAEGIRKAILDLKIPHRASPTNEYVTVSIGAVTVIPMEDRMPNDIISLADKALYKSKQNGRNQVTPYSHQFI